MVHGRVHYIARDAAQGTTRRPTEAASSHWPLNGFAEQGIQGEHVALHQCTKPRTAGTGSQGLPSQNQEPVGMILTKPANGSLARCKCHGFPRTSRHIVHVSQRDSRFSCRLVTLCVLACSVGPHSKLRYRHFQRRTITSKATQVRRGASPSYSSN